MKVLVQGVCVAIVTLALGYFIGLLYTLIVCVAVFGLVLFIFYRVNHSKMRRYFKGHAGSPASLQQAIDALGLPATTVAAFVVKESKIGGMCFKIQLTEEGRKEISPWDEEGKKPNIVTAHRYLYWYPSSQV